MGVGVPLAVGAAVVGAALGPLLRSRILHHAVDVDQPWRHDCPQCGITLIPPGGRGVVGVLPASGRCPACRHRIGPAPGSVEALTAAVFALLALRVEEPLVMLALCYLAALGVALAFIDVAVRRLPDQLTVAALVGLVALLGVAALAEPQRVGAVANAVVSGLGLAACYLILVLASPAGMGLGDAKLALSVGTALGWFGWTSTVFGAALAFLLAGAWSLVLLALGRVTRKTQIPHGPFMLLGALAVLLRYG